MSLSTMFGTLTWIRYSALGAQSSEKEMVAPSLLPVTFWADPTWWSSAPLRSRKTVIVASLAEASMSVTVMMPFPLPSQVAAAESP